MLPLIFLLVVSISGFRPPAVPIATFGPQHQLYQMRDTTIADYTRYWDGTPMPLNVLVLVDHKQLFWLISSSFAESIAQQLSAPKVGPLITSIQYQISVGTDVISVTLQFLHFKLPGNLSMMSFPGVSIELEVTSPTTHDVALYVELSAQNCVHLGDTENVTWSTTPMQEKNTVSLKMGSTNQQPLQSNGDDFMLNWGFMHLSASASGSQVSAGSASNIRSSLLQNGVLPTIQQPNTAPSNFGPVLAALANVGPSNSSHIFFTYDEVQMMYYYGEILTPRWANNGTTTMSQLVDAMEENYDKARELVLNFDSAEMAFYTSTISPQYSDVASLAYRQVMAAIDFTHSDHFSEDWCFLKEISSDGDINTMDVVFPASPAFLYYNPTILKQILLPVLHFANNETWFPYTNPFSPHQLGVYPIANDSTKNQEYMPLENSGNMFLMLLGYVKATNHTDLFYYPRYWPLFENWANYMMTTQLPVPPKQICTDDFAGLLAQNTNLAAKGIIAMQAFYELCMFAVPNTTTCAQYEAAATTFADYFVANATEIDPKTHLFHTKLAYNWSDSWSTKYNMLWQRLLQMEKPFTAFGTLAANEVAYYATQLNEFGFPMDLRHTYQKLDWFTWGSLLSGNASTFANLFTHGYEMANETPNRWALTDLFDTVTSNIVFRFTSRPVVGALFAALMLYG